MPFGINRNQKRDRKGRFARDPRGSTAPVSISRPNHTDKGAQTGQPTYVSAYKMFLRETPLPEPHTVERDIIALGESEHDARSEIAHTFEAKQVFRGLKREGAISGAQPPTQDEINAFVNAPCRQFEPRPTEESHRAICQIASEQGHTMDGPTWYATTHYLEQLATNRARKSTSQPNGPRHDPTMVQLESLYQSRHASQADYDKYMAFLDKHGISYE